MTDELKAELEEVEGRVPRYLYRTYSHRSSGRNSLWSFRPGSTTYNNRLSDIPRQRAKDMLVQHLLWTNSSNDQFISWTDSLLWALQHAISKDHRGDREINICVLDTSKIETCSFFAASDLLRIYNVPDMGKLAHRYYVAEYLYHGGLFVHGSSSTVTFNSLRECGLSSLVPEMEDAYWKPKLCKAVDYFRNTVSSVSRPVTPDEGRTALQIASLFKKEFTLPVMVALLSVRRRAPDDAQFLKLVADYAEPSLDFTGSRAPYRGTCTEPPELANLRQLMDAAHAATQKRERERSIDEMRELGDTLDALNASLENRDTALKGTPDEILSWGVLSQWLTATQTLKEHIVGNWANEGASPHWGAGKPRPTPFPARMPSEPVSAQIKPPRRTTKPVHVVFADDSEDEQPSPASDEPEIAESAASAVSVARD